ncbi:TetR/AcrR family transcriptional regulator, partial [Streptomyces sp. NPDC005373]|uniref:TetR/AcrR family transcriptional regulator n=1 Tax=Streptomyces sp. NPDC005373 TaxID=3156879 RepID=UPI0033A645B1
MTAPVGRRERKKAATRQALADTALNLFLEHGYDHVTIRDIAEAVDVSTTTLLKYFATKEALVFDEDTEQEAALVSAVRDRPEGQSIPQALCAHIKHVRISADGSDARFAAFVRLVNIPERWQPRRGALPEGNQVRASTRITMPKGAVS